MDVNNPLTNGIFIGIDTHILIYPSETLANLVVSCCKPTELTGVP